MKPTTTLHITPEPGLFNPEQVQPRGALSLGLAGLAAWFREHVMSPRQMLLHYESGFVVWGIHLEYHDRLTFFDTDRIDLRSTAMLMKDGLQVDFHHEFLVENKKKMDLRMVIAPIWIGETDELSALPSKVEGELLAHFPPETRGNEIYESPLPGLMEEIPQRGAKLGERTHPFTVHRSSCEMADQWYFAEVPRFVGNAREVLAMEQGASSPMLRRSVGLPLEKLHILYNRPFYFLDEGRVETQAYVHEERPKFVHRLHGETQSEPYAIAVEELATKPSGGA